MDKLEHCKRALVAWRRLHNCGYDTPETFEKMLTERTETIRMVGIIRYVHYMLGISTDVSPSIVCLIDRDGRDLHPSEDGTTLGEYLVRHFDADSLPVLVRYRSVELAL
jgi:hypothetical protein